MRAPVSRSRPLFSPGPPACWSWTEPLVGDLGLLGELDARPGGSPSLVLQMPARGLGVFRGAGGDLQPAQLLLGQRGLLVGVVLAAGEHAPEQDRELARGRDDRLAVPAAGAGAVIEGVQRPGLPDRRSRRPRPAPSARRPSRAC